MLLIEGFYTNEDYGFSWADEFTDLGLILSPYNDNNNDLFLIQGPRNADILINSFDICDRWGNLVYEQKDFDLSHNNVAWDGQFNGEEVNTGIYVYYMNYVLDGREINDVGTLTVIR